MKLSVYGKREKTGWQTKSRVALASSNKSNEQLWMAHRGIDNHLYLGEIDIATLKPLNAGISYARKDWCTKHAPALTLTSGGDPVLFHVGVDTGCIWYAKFLQQRKEWSTLEKLPRQYYWDAEGEFHNCTSTANVKTSSTPIILKKYNNNLELYSFVVTRYSNYPFEVYRITDSYHNSRSSLIFKRNQVMTIYKENIPYTGLSEVTNPIWRQNEEVTMIWVADTIYRMLICDGKLIWSEIPSLPAQLNQEYSYKIKEAEIPGHKKANCAPAVAIFENKFIIAFKEGQSIYIALFEPIENQVKILDIEEVAHINDAKTQPALAVVGGMIYLVYAGGENDEIFSLSFYPSESNEVKFLIDGETVFKRVDELFDQVEKSKNGYVHMSFWECNALTKLTNDFSLKDKIKKLTQKGIEVRILLWMPSIRETISKYKDNLDDLEKLFEVLKVIPSEKVVNTINNTSRDIKKQITEIDKHIPEWVQGTENTNTECMQELNENLKQELEHEGKSNTCEVRTISYENPLFTYHMKTMIFYDGREVRAIVGGLNMTNTYRSNKPHKDENQFHDVAVEFSGHSTLMVENDFHERWYQAKNTTHNLSGPTPMSSFRFLSARNNELHEVRVKRTIYGRISSVKEIQEELIQQIKNAESYVYIENYAIFDDAVIDCLAEKISQKKQQGKDFNVILNVIDPNSPAHKAEILNGWFHYVTYVCINLASCDTFTYNDKYGKEKVVTNKGTLKLERNKTALLKDGINYLINGDNLWKDAVVILPNQERVPINKITGFRKKDGTNDIEPIPMYMLVNHQKWQRIYIHSKVAIIDDKWAVVGSANFNPRSMKNDGEMSVFVRGKTVKDFRDTLWKEYFNDQVCQPHQWRQMANDNGINNNITGEITIPIPFERFPKEPPVPINPYDHTDYH